jgi:hypothetical protein
LADHIDQIHHPRCDANLTHIGPESIQSTGLSAAPPIISPSKFSDMNKVMDLNERLFMVAAFTIFAFAVWEFWQHQQNLKALRRTHPDKWTRVPVLPDSIDLYAHMRKPTEPAQAPRISTPYRPLHPTE